MPQPLADPAADSTGGGRSAHLGVGPGGLTITSPRRFPDQTRVRGDARVSRRDLGRGLLAAGAGVGSVAATAGTAGAAGSGHAGSGHTTVVVRVPDPTSATGTRPSRICYLDRADVHSAAVPVVYLLHGLPGTAGDFESSGATSALFAAASSIGLRLVVVSPAGASLHPGDPRTDTEWGDDVAGQWQLETWMHTRLRTAVETTAVRATRDRIIGGFSMGGFGAAMIGMRHPAVYGSVAAIAGYFHLDDPDEVFGTDPENRVLHRPDHLIFPHRTQRYLLADSTDDPLPLTAPETPRFAQLLRDHGYSPEVYRPTGAHDLALVVSSMPALAAFIAAR